MVSLDFLPLKLVSMEYETLNTTFPTFFLCSVLKIHCCFPFLHGMSELNVSIVLQPHVDYPCKKWKNFRIVFLVHVCRKNIDTVVLDVSYPIETDFCYGNTAVQSKYMYMYMLLNSPFACI